MGSIGGKIRWLRASIETPEEELFFRGQNEIQKYLGKKLMK